MSGETGSLPCRWVALAPAPPPATPRGSWWGHPSAPQGSCLGTPAAGPKLGSWDGGGRCHAITRGPRPLASPPSYCPQRWWPRKPLCPQEPLLGWAWGSLSLGAGLGSPGQMLPAESCSPTQVSRNQPETQHKQEGEPGTLAWPLSGWEHLGQEVRAGPELQAQGGFPALPLRASFLAFEPLSLISACWAQSTAGPSLWCPTKL